MSINISKVVIYLKLMLDEQTPKEQKFGLLYTASPVQIRALTEIVHNLLLGSLTLNESLIKLIRKRRKLLLNFSNPERSFKTKLRALRSHYRYFTELLCLASPVIFQQKNELHSENGVNSDWAVRTTVKKKAYWSAVRRGKVRTRRAAAAAARYSRKTKNRQVDSIEILI